jgi:3-oxoacyl-[acyl-carrier protein] reductase
MKLKGKVALITGASRNIGRATALAIAEEGGDVVLTTRASMEALNTVSREVRTFGVDVLAFQADIVDVQAMIEVVRKAEAELGKVDILVNNAVDRGPRTQTTFLELSREQWEATLNINLGGPFNCVKAVLPGMMNRRWGRIINFSGINGQWGFEYRTAMATAKAGIIGFTKSLAHELGEYNITVNAVSPGAIESINGPIHPETVARAAIKREGLPMEIASLVVYLCTDGAGYITGQVLPANGGAYV